MENKNQIYIFTDGSSLGNPGPGGYGAIIISGDTVREFGGGENPTTNNRMELLATITALENVGATSCEILLHTDSSYVINGITKWVWGWKKNNWVTSTKTEVVNRDLWEKLLGAIVGKKIEWKYVAGHVGIAGNNRADAIAVSNSKAKPEKLYDGDFGNYPIQNILDTSHDVEQKKERSDSRAHSKAKAFSYLSLVDGKIMKHSTWGECEVRVKGKKAKFKKATSVSDEASIIKEWGG